MVGVKEQLEKKQLNKKQPKKKQLEKKHLKKKLEKKQLEIVQIPIGKLTSLKTFRGQTNAPMIVNVMEGERVVQVVGVKENREIDIHIYIVIYKIRNKF